MKVSIVTISFNQAMFLAEAIDSVASQDYEDIEYIMVDPGSTDGSREIIQDKKNLISKIILDPDCGPADGLNNGFAAASGEIFGFLNADDVFEPSAVREAVEFLETHRDIDVVSGHGWAIDSGGTRWRRIYSDGFSLGMLAYNASILLQPSTFFRASAYHRAGGFNVNNRCNWDSELFMDMALTGARFSLTHKFWSGFRIHKQGITGSGKLGQRLVLQHDLMFRKIKGRDRIPLDTALLRCARLARKVLNPLDTYERLKHGPISGRYA